MIGRSDTGWFYSFGWGYELGRGPVQLHAEGFRTENECRMAGLERISLARSRLHEFVFKIQVEDLPDPDGSYRCVYCGALVEGIGPFTMHQAAHGFALRCVSGCYRCRFCLSSAWTLHQVMSKTDDERCPAKAAYWSEKRRLTLLDTLQRVR